MPGFRSALCLILAVAAPAAAKTLEIAPEPEWVEVLEIPADDPNLRAEVEGLATIQFDFDPEFEQTSLVRMRILRAGQEIDLKDQSTAEIYRRETRLDEGIIDGTLTAVLQVTGPRMKSWSPNTISCRRRL